MACKGSLLEGMSSKSGEGLSIDHQVEDSTCTALSAYVTVSTRRSKTSQGVSQFGTQGGGGGGSSSYLLAFFEIFRIQLQDSRYRQSLHGNWFLYNFAVNVSKLSGETRRVGEGKDGDIWKYIVESALVETFHSSDYCGVTFAPPKGVSKTRNTPKNRL